MEDIDKLIAENKFEEAQKKLEQLLEKDSNNNEALKLLGLCYVNHGKYDDGRKIFETVVKYLPEDANSAFTISISIESTFDPTLL